MVYTLFFSRLRDTGPAGLEAYRRHASAVHGVAVAEHPGFVTEKTYVAEDGERLTVVVFRDAETQLAWKVDPVHREAQRKGVTDYYDEYRIVVCEGVRERAWKRRVEEAER